MNEVPIVTETVELADGTKVFVHGERGTVALNFINADGVAFGGATATSGQAEFLALTLNRAAMACNGVLRESPATAESVERARQERERARASLLQPDGPFTIIDGKRVPVEVLPKVDAYFVTGPDGMPVEVDRATYTETPL